MDLTKLQRMSLGALVTLEVHGRDVIENLVSAGVTSDGDFEWSVLLIYSQTDIFVRIDGDVS